MLNLIDEHTRQSLLVRPEHRWSSAKVIEALADVMVMKGVPEHSPHTRRRLLDQKRSCATLTVHGTKDRADQALAHNYQQNPYWNAYLRNIQMGSVDAHSR
jgi:hypothetical protein